MKAYFKSLEWNKGSRDFVQGVKGNRVPYNAIYGGNGSFVCENPAKLILTVIAQDGREVSRNIISVVRAINGWARITQKRVDLVEAKFQQATELELDDEDYIVDLDYYVCAS